MIENIFSNMIVTFPFAKFDRGKKKMEFLAHGTI